MATLIALDEVCPLVVCGSCTHRCDGKSLNNYQFEDDTKRSEVIEEEIMYYLRSQSCGHLTCNKVALNSREWGQPDIEIRTSAEPNRVQARLEVKYQTRAFMKSAHIPCEPRLSPWETVALNTSDLDKYIAYYEQDKILTHIVWRLERTCLGIRYFYQDVARLKQIRDYYGLDRQYIRKMGVGDIDNNGRNKGVKENYHFSIHELRPFDNYTHYLLDYLKVAY